MLKRVVFTLCLIVLILIVSLLWTHAFGNLFSTFQLFRATRWVYLVTFTVGTITGLVVARIKIVLGSRRVGQLPERHDVSSIIEHWGTAVGIFLLTVSGLLIYLHAGLPAIKLHFLGLFLTLLFGSYFLADFFVLKKYKSLLPNKKDVVDGTIKKYLFQLKTKETGKYLSSQKSSFLIFTVLGSLILISGIIKLLFYYMPLPFRLTEIATKIHNISALLFGLTLTIHILLVILRRANWPLLRSWFNGKDPKR
jgi:cytochrome b subunit of formate dehydrogenase